MNNSLNSNRLGMLIRRQWIEFGKIYLMSLAILAGIFIAFYGYNIYAAIQKAHNVPGMLSFRPFVFVFMGLLFMLIISGSYFSNLGQKPKAIFELLLPASRLEKFVVALFYTVIVTTVSYLLIFYLVDLGFVSYIRSHFVATHSYVDRQTGETILVDHLRFFFQLRYNEDVYWLLFLPYLLGAVFLLGSVAFTKFQHIKTAILLTVYVFLYTLCMVKIMQFVTDNTERVTTGIFNEEINVVKVVCAMGILLTVTLWGIAYLRLKEKEV